MSRRACVATRHRASVAAMATLVALAALAPVGCRAKTEPPSGGSPATDPGNPPTTSAPVAESDVTWVVSAPAIDATSPGDYDLAAPTTLYIEFSGPINQTSVEKAILENLPETSGASDTMRMVWKTDRTITLDIGEISSVTYAPLTISPDGGFDASGKRLTESIESFFHFYPGAPLTCWRLWPGQPDRPAEKMAALDQPYTVTSLSPTGDRMLLWLRAVPYAGVPGPLNPGRFYLLDLDQPELVELSQEDRWGRYFWLPDGTLVYGSLTFSPSPGGTSPSWLYTAPASDGPGGQAVRWVRGFEGVTGGDLTFSTDGLKAAKVAEGRAVVFDLSDQTTRAVEGVSAQPCPSGFDDSSFVLVSVAQDGRHVAYSDWTPTEEDDYAMTVWVADTVTGEKWSVASGALGGFEWSPTGEALLLQGEGVVDLTGQIIYPCAGEGFWSPNGEVVWLRDVGLVRVSDWTVLRKLTVFEEPWSSEYYAWSPDGTKLAGGFGDTNLVATAEGLTLWEDESPRRVPIWSSDSSPSLDLSGIGPKARVEGWSGDSLLVVTGGHE